MQFQSIKILNLLINSENSLITRTESMQSTSNWIRNSKTGVMEITWNNGKENITNPVTMEYNNSWHRLKSAARI